jgi:hypothetical protein
VRLALRYKKRKSNRWRTCRIAGHEFMRRFLTHVLPKGFHKVRYFGLWHPAKRDLASKARLLLLLEQPQSTPATVGVETDRIDDAGLATAGDADSVSTQICPHCHQGHLSHIRRLEPKFACGP